MKYETLLEGRGAVRLENRKTLGGSWVLDQLWKDLGIQDVLRRTLETRELRTPVERLIFAMVLSCRIELESPHNKKKQLFTTMTCCARSHQSRLNCQNLGIDSCGHHS